MFIVKVDNLNKKLLANDKILENINAKLDDFSFAMKNQLSFNKMLAAAIPYFESSKIPSKPKIWRLLILLI